MSELALYVDLDRRIDEAEGEGIRARWRFGRELLRERVGEQLPQGRLDQVAAATGKSRRELQYRMQFAVVFPTEEEVRNALHTFGSWHDLVNKGLGRPESDPAQTPPLPEGVYRTIIADPPWDVKAGAHEWGGSAASQALEYPTLPAPRIKALEVDAHAAEDAHLYLWTINAYVRDAYDIVEAWGFEPSTLLVWCKPSHGLGLGGAYVLTTEYVLFATRGSLRPKRRIDASWFQWPRGRHSVKPAAFYGLVEDVSPGPYLELFGRELRDGWEVWGDEVAA